MSSKGDLMPTVCVPVLADNGLQSPLSAHFGAAPYFMLVDLDNQEHSSVVNRNDHQVHGVGTPVDQISQLDIDILIVGGIGIRAVDRFATAGIKVYRTDLPSAGDAVAALAAGKLDLIDPSEACAGHH